MDFQIVRGEPFMQEWLLAEPYSFNPDTHFKLQANVDITDGGVLIQGYLGEGTALLVRDDKLWLSVAIFDTAQLGAGDWSWSATVRNSATNEVVFEESGTLTVVDGEPKVTREARPWDLFNPNIPRVTAEVKESRLAICHQCPLLKMGICLSCGCVMQLKAGLPHASCPEGRW